MTTFLDPLTILEKYVWSCTLLPVTEYNFFSFLLKLFCSFYIFVMLFEVHMESSYSTL